MPIPLFRPRPAGAGVLLLSLICLLLAACAGSPRPAPEPPPAKPQPCVAQACPVCPVCPAPPKEAVPPPAPPAAPPLQPAAWEELEGWHEDDPGQAWAALLASCSRLKERPQWREPCQGAAQLWGEKSPARLRSFLEQHFSPWRVVNPDGSSQGLVTGYYEPLIRGSRERSERYRWPIYGVPADMLVIELGDVYPELKRMRLRGRIEGNRVLPYWNRAELASQGDAVLAPVLLWAEDPVELFFLQVQGSGRVELPDGSLVRIGYADQNGHPYQSIGRWLVAQGELSLDKASMQGIKAWAQAHPQRLQELLNVNPSYVFFRELQGEGGPIGALGVPVSAGRSIAVDPAVIPLGAPVFLATTQPLSERPLQRLMLAQDTGGAIKGAVRADFFWGFGAEAGAQAGRMRQQGRMWVLYPRGLQPEVER